MSMPMIAGTEITSHRDLSSREIMQRDELLGALRLEIPVDVST
jgi:hypothetical protein